MSYYLNYLEHYKNLNLHLSQICDWIKRNQADSIYHNLNNAEKEILNIKPLLTDIQSIDNASFEATLKNIVRQKAKILDAYEVWFSEAEFIGDKQAFEAPDVIVLLGASHRAMNIRLVESLPLLKRHTDSVVVFSGGGFLPVESEADYMHKEAIKAGLKNTMLTEKTSMDTIGNALFTKFELKKNGLLERANRILIITSRFHTLRAYYYFKNILNNQNDRAVAVYGVQTTCTKLQSIIAHELQSEYEAQKKLDLFNSQRINPVDDQAILLKLFFKHKLYENRYDILNHYLALS